MNFNIDIKQSFIPLGLLLVLSLFACQENASSQKIVIPEQPEPERIRKRQSKLIIGGRPPMPAQRRIPSPEEISSEIVAKNLRVPWAMELTKSGSKLFFTERPGRLKVLDFNGNKSPQIRTLRNRKKVLHWGEGGLMGLALHPNFEADDPNSNWIYLCETYGEYNNAQNRIVRIQIGSDSPQSRVQTLIDGMPAASYHDGCQLEFGPDDMLYATMGDAGNPDLAQDTTAWGGKILKMTDDGQPADRNPFEGKNAAPYVYSYGHRNPQGLAWAPETRVLYASEHGPSGEFGVGGYDEINQIKKGHNYGWPDVIGAPGMDKYTDPVLLFDSPHMPPAGMAFNSLLSERKTASLFVGSLLGEVLLKVGFTTNSRYQEIVSLTRWFETEFYSGQFGRIRAVETGPDGALYLSTSNRDGRGSPISTDDRIIKISPSAPE